jgi:hypothetical protein
MLKFKQPFKSSKPSKQLKLSYWLNKKLLRQRQRDRLKKRLQRQLLKPKRRQDLRRRLPRKLLLRLRQPLLPLRRRLTRTSSLLKLKPKLLPSKRDFKRKPLIPLSMSKKWLIRLLNSQNPKLRSRLPKPGKLPPQLPFKKLRKKDKKWRMRRLLFSNKERRTRNKLKKQRKEPKKLLMKRQLPPTRSRTSRLRLLLLRQDLRQILRLQKMLLRLTKRSWRDKELPMKQDSRNWLMLKQLKSRLLKKLPKKLTRWPSLLERPKSRDKLLIMQRKWPIESLNSLHNSSMFGFQDQLEFLKSLSPCPTSMLPRT